MSDTSSDGATERNIDLAFAFIRETLVDPGTLEGVPDGVTFVLVPADDPQLAEANISSGIEAVRDGRDVYFKHVSASEHISKKVGS